MTFFSDLLYSISCEDKNKKKIELDVYHIKKGKLKVNSLGVKYLKYEYDHPTYRKPRKFLEFISKLSRMDCWGYFKSRQEIAEFFGVEDIPVSILDFVKHGPGAFLLKKLESAGSKEALNSGELPNSSASSSPIESSSKWMIDLTELEALRMRDGYNKLGCKIIFNSDLSEYEITDVAEGINSSRYELIAKASLINYITLVEHLLRVHLLIANDLSLTVRLTDSDFSKYLWPFQFGVPQVNQDAEDVLLRERGILHRITGCEYSSLKEFLKVKYIAIDVKKYQDYFGDAEKVEKCPILQEGKKYWEALSEYFSQIPFKKDEVWSQLNVKGLDDRWTLKYALTYSVWHSTFYHHIVGDNLDKLLPWFSPHVRVDEHLISKDTAKLTYALIHFTSSDVPTLKSEFWKFQQHPSAEADFNRLQSALSDLEEENVKPGDIAVAAMT